MGGREGGNTRFAQQKSLFLIAEVESKQCEGGVGVCTPMRSAGSVAVNLNLS